MKLMLKSYLVCGAVLAYCAASALPLPQNFEEPTRYYKPMKMEDNMRGAFNMTPCVRALLACWESIPPEMVCGHFYRMMSICDFRLLFCKNEHGWQFSMSDWPYQMSMWDYNCPKEVPFGDYSRPIYDVFGGSRFETWNQEQEDKAFIAEKSGTWFGFGLWK